MVISAYAGTDLDIRRIRRNETPVLFLYDRRSNTPPARFPF